MDKTKVHHDFVTPFGCSEHCATHISVGYRGRAGVHRVAPWTIAFSRNTYRFQHLSHPRMSGFPDSRRGARLTQFVPTHHGATYRSKFAAHESRAHNSMIDRVSITYFTSRPMGLYVSLRRPLRIEYPYSSGVHFVTELRILLGFSRHYFRVLVALLVCSPLALQTLSGCAHRGIVTASATLVPRLTKSRISP